MTVKEAQVHMNGESVGIPENAMVYYVVLQGPFTLSNVSVPPGMGPLPTAQTGIEVFDAQTGNILVWGA